MDEYFKPVEAKQTPGFKLLNARMRSTLPWILFILWSIGLDLLALDPGKSLSQYRCRHWGAEHGLPHPSANAINQASDGYIWTATSYGIARFNGHNFYSFLPENTPALTRPKINCIYARKNGSLWFGTQGGGILEYKHGKFFALSNLHVLIGPNINCIFEDSKGRMWIGSTLGIHIWDGNANSSTNSESLLPKMEAFSIFEDEKEQIWIGAATGLYGPITHLPAIEPTQHPSIHTAVRSICSNGRGGLWLGTDMGLYHLDKDAVQLYKKENGLKSPLVTTVYRDGLGTVWIGTKLGLNRIIGSKIVAEAPIPTLDFVSINSFTEDTEGNFWIACGDGLFSLSDTRFTTLSAHDGLIFEEANSLAEGPDGTVWIATARGGIYHQKDASLKAYAQRPSFDTLTSILIDRRNRLWTGTRRQGLFCIDQNVVRSFNLKKGLSSNNIMSLCEDSAGCLWIGTSEGLNKIENGKIDVFSLKAKGGQPNIRSIHSETNGQIWLGTSKGLYLLSQTVTNHYDIDEGLPISLVYHVTQDREQRIWIGTANGLSCLLNERWHSWKPMSIADKHHVYWLVDDGHGFIWYSTPRTIFRVSIKSLLEHWRNSTAKVEFTEFDHADGLLDSACIGGRQPAGCQTRDGRIWFPTWRGLAIADPAQVTPNTIPPRVHIEKFAANGKEVEIGDHITLPSGTRRINMHFAALSFTRPNSVQYQYKLDGFDTEWINSGDHFATYANLKPGNYHFQVNACNRDGVWNEFGAALSFTITPAFYQTTWFYMVGGFTVIFTALVWHIGRLRGLRRQKIQLERLVGERTHELEQRMQDCIRLEGQLRQAQKLEAVGQMAAGVAHYFNNLLTVIKGNASLLLEMEALSKPGKDNIRSIDSATCRAADIVRHLLTFSQKQWIRKGSIDLNQIACKEAENLKQIVAQNISVKTELAAELPLIEGDINLITKAISNVTANSIDFMPGNGIITIRTSIEEISPAKLITHPEIKAAKYCLVTISDTGKGMSVETQKHLFEPFFTTKDVGKGTGLGLAFVYGVVKQLGGFIEVTSALGQGTEFRLYFLALQK